MQVEFIETPAGKIQILRNGKPEPFHVKLVENAEYEYYGVTVVASNYYTGSIDVSSFSVGDVLLMEFEHGKYECDGGGERKDNIVGEYAGYTLGIGTISTDDYDDENYGKDFLLYCNYGFTEAGFEFQIVKNPADYIDNQFRTTIQFDVLWEQIENPYAWDIVSFYTS